MAKSPEAMAATMKGNIKEKTGKTLSQWLKLIKTSQAEKHGQIVKFLKADHGVTHGFASLIAHEYLATGQPSAGTDSLVDAQYAGAKAGLLPIYQALIKMVESFGKDIEVVPKKAYVSVRRNKQFAIIQPSARDRIDVGINLKGTKAKGRLEQSGSFNAMVSHRVRITEKKQVNAELKQWLMAAYEAA
jgi:hypothetical protein